MVTPGLPAHLFPVLLRISASFACCSGVSLFFIRTSSVTCARLISRSIDNTFSNCASDACSSTCGCLTSETSFSISSCSFHCHSVNFTCAWRISVLRKAFCSSLRAMASWCWITSSGAKKICPIGSWSGCWPRATPATRNSRAQTQRILTFISFLLIHLRGHLRGNLQVRLTESRRCPQNFSPGSFEQGVAWCSPFRQLLRSGQFGLRHSPYFSSVQHQTDY